MLPNLREDFRRCTDGSVSELARALLRQGLWAVAEYRFGYRARHSAPRVIRPVVAGVSVFTHLAWRS